MEGANGRCYSPAWGNNELTGRRQQGELSWLLVGLRSQGPHLLMICIPTPSCTVVALLESDTFVRCRLVRRSPSCRLARPVSRGRPGTEPRTGIGPDGKDEV